jgi:hypothetical protein
VPARIYTGSTRKSRCRGGGTVGASRGAARTFRREPWDAEATQDVVAADSQDAAAVDAAAADPTARFRRALTRHRPVYRFDSDEDYSPLAVNAITNNTGNELLRDNDDLIARRNPNGGGRP